MSSVDPSTDRHLASVRPPGWVNPVPAGIYNLVVIGGGTAGLVCAAGAAGLGARVALVEARWLGGDCLNAGCVPSKALLHAARSGRGAADAFATVRRIRADVAPHDSAARFKGLGVDVYFGRAQFVSPRDVEVSGARLRFARAVVATGSRAALPDIPGLHELDPLTNESIFELESAPPRLAIVGGGPIGCELAQAFVDLGTTVTIVEATGHLLPREDEDAGRTVEAALRARGVDVYTNGRIIGASRDGANRVLRLADGRDVGTETVLVATGRAPNIEGLGLEAAGIEADASRGVHVDDHLRTTNRRVYAAGDVCLPQKFTHAADASARVVIRNALFRGRARVSAIRIPWTTYTTPEVAGVGLSSREAEARGVAVDAYERPLNRLDRAVVDQATRGFVRVLTAKGTDRIVGATIVAPHAAEMISEVAVAMAADMGLGRLSSVVHPYPSYAESLRQLGDDYNRTRLTPRVKAALSTYLRWTAR